jgi:RimJ/RimL family protein N-acetyltransferase
MELRLHTFTLKQESLVLRPLTEDDWNILLQWNSDPEVLYYAEGDDVTSRSLEEIQAIYRTVSQSAFCFIIEYEQQPIGECWLQNLYLDRLLHAHPNTDCRRIDLMIGNKQLWGVVLART